MNVRPKEKHKKVNIHTLSKLCFKGKKCKNEKGAKLKIHSAFRSQVCGLRLAGGDILSETIVLQDKTKLCFIAKGLC